MEKEGKERGRGGGSVRDREEGRGGEPQSIHFAVSIGKRERKEKRGGEATVSFILLPLLVR